MGNKKTFKNGSKIKNALISVSNKEKLNSVIKNSNKFKINLISSGGTYKFIKKGFNCKNISSFTNFDEMLDGRVKPTSKYTQAFIR